MKRFLSLAFLIIVFTTITNAQTIEKKWGFGAGAGGYLNLENSSLGLTPDVYLSRYLSPSFDLMANVFVGYFGNKNINEPLDNLNPSLNLRYKFFNGKIMPVESKFQPYITAGIGYLFDNAKTGVNFNAGAGVKYPLNKTLSLFAETGYIHGIESTRTTSDNSLIDVRDNFAKLIIGIEISFIKQADSDKDGVIDPIDQCPDTPKGATVDEKGCPSDTDNDGVFDGIDECPNTDPGLEVDEKGCVLDTDGDGISDAYDSCPLVAGIKSLNGCPDSDGDGITDTEDSCPKVAGLKAFDGCPDSDGDGLADKDDECPLVAGLTKFNGCPDSDGDGVQDKNDKCPETPKGAEVDKDGCSIDSDNDGIPNGIDVCPDVAGVVANNGCPLDEKEVEWMDNVKVNSIFFATNSVEITTYSKGKIADLIKLMKEHKEYNVNVFGFADQRGNATYNAELSMRRAKATVAYLISQGIAENRFSTKAIGEEHSVTKDLTEAELQNSRRVDFNVYK